MDKSQGGIPNRRYKWDFPPNPIFSPTSVEFMVKNICITGVYTAVFRKIDGRAN